MSEVITSLQNPRIKNIAKLEKASERKAQGLVVIEGMRELGLALDAGCKVESLFVCEEIAGQEVRKELESRLGKEKLALISKAVFEKVAYRENSDGIIALVVPVQRSLEDLVLSSNPFVIVLEAVEKPGNLGAILRTADAAKVDAVIVCDPRTDVYNPNTIRSSIGCVFTTQVVACTTEEAMGWLKENNIRTYAAALTATSWYHETDMKQACAVVMGTEATGLSESWLKGSDKQVKIPMRGKIDSLNVSTSCAVLVFEAMRQRGF